MISRILLPIAATFLCYGLYHAVQFLYREFTSPLRNIVGPRNPSFLLGNFKEIADDSQLISKWRSQFGRTFRFKGLFSMSELHTSDLKAVNHIINNHAIYRKAPFMRDTTRRLVGEGILTKEFDEHKRQRRIMNQAFGVAQIRLLTEVFVETTIQMRDIWTQQIAQGNGSGQVDVFDWLRRMTLDVIGQAGFNYQFNALDGRKPNELNRAFTDLMHSPHAQQYAGFRLAQSIVPILKLLPLPGAQVLKRLRKKMDSIGGQIVADSKANLRNVSEGEKTLRGRKDLLSVLLKSNLAKDLPESQRMSDAEVVSQIPTFFLAGHETTSSAVAWALHALSQHPAVQKKLREELFTLSTENPTMDELNSLPYLESVVRETMRLHSPVVFTQRMAMEDDVLPLSKPYIDKNGKSHDSLPIPKGQMMHIPILAINTDKETWGDDALEFKPERWEKIPEAVSAVPGVWANLFTFFAGPHNCIGFRFSLVEIKVLLFTLVRAFEFEPAVPIATRTAGLIQRPTVLGDKAKGSALPLILKPVNVQAY